MKKIQKNLIYSIVSFLVIFQISTICYLPVFGYGGGGGGSYNPTPTSITAVNTPLVLTSSQIGYGTVTNESGVSFSITVPRGVVLNRTKFNLEIDAETYTISATDINDNELNSFLNSFDVKIMVPSLDENYDFYLIDENNNFVEIADVNYNYEENSISFSTNEVKTYLLKNNNQNIVLESSTEESSIDLDEGQVLGVEVTSYSDITNLASIDSDLVNVISANESNLLYSKNSFVNMSNSSLAVYNKLTTTVDITNTTEQNKYAVAEFIENGTQTTKNLGAGERAGVINSYYAAFGKMPEKSSDWQDVIKISNGRWPAERAMNEEENVMNKSFVQVYKRTPDMNNANDNAAVTIMTYGLRPVDRNMYSEKVAIKTFESIYGYTPSSATDWDTVRAIAYSGATR